MKKIFAILIYLLLVMFPHNIQAAHIIGGEVSYQCLGQENYQITIKLFRDCNGGGALFDSSFPGSLTGQVTVYRGSNPTPFTSVILSAPVITPVDYNIDGCIANLPDLCVEQGIYTFELNLPASTESYFIVYQRCCRNVTISNILAPGETGATYMAELSGRSQEVCNIGAQFNEFPPVLICANEPLFFDHSAADFEGDSLVYGFCSPLKGGNIYDLAPDPDAAPPHEPVDFVTPTYSPGAPLAGDPVVSIDPQTGWITGTPTITGQFVIGVCAREYRDGQLINIVQRDFQFNVMPCNFAVQAGLDGETMDGEHFLYETCGDLEITMLNESTDEAYIESYFWKFDLGGNIPLISNEKHLTIEFPATGTYRGLLILNPGGACTDTAWVKVNIFELPAVEIAYEYDPCQPGPVAFATILPTSEAVITDWMWDFGDGTSSEETDPLHLFSEERIYEVTLNVIDENGCTNSEALKLDYAIDILPVLETPPSAAGCAPLTVSYGYLLDYLDEDYLIYWDFGEESLDSGLVIEQDFFEPGEYNLNLQIISPSGCETILEYENIVMVEAPPVANFEMIPETVNKMELIQFQDLSERAVSWAWAFGDGGTSAEQHPVWTFRHSGNYEVQLIVEDQYGCQDAAFLPIEVRPVMKIYVPNTFSPNDDGHNDEFLAFPSCPLEAFQMKIFNRWGAQLFESNDIGKGWNGIFKNELFDPGVFTWLITFRHQGKVHFMRGDVTLVR